MNSRLLFLALCAKRLVIDLITSENRTYQISGDHRFRGMHERIFHEGSHPTRRNVGEAEAQAALNAVTEIRLWEEHQGYRVVSAAELEAELAPFPVR